MYTCTHTKALGPFRLAPSERCELSDWLVSVRVSVRYNVTVCVFVRTGIERTMYCENNTCGCEFNNNGTPFVRLA